MNAKIFAVIDTNVLVSALLAKHPDSAPVQIFEHLLDKDIVPLFNDEIILEYSEVFRRPKFSFDQETVKGMLSTIVEFGESSDRISSSKNFPDPKDIVFYEVALSKDGSYLVTGNVKHFPKEPIVVTPAQMLDIIKKMKGEENSID